MEFSQALAGNKIFDIVSQASLELDVRSYVIGGFVRDLLLKRPCKDIDIVVAGNGIALAKKVNELSGKDQKISIFKNFGTAMIRFGEFEIEFVGARKESYNRDSRKPMVENGTLEDDQKRRDFTINALAIGLNHDDYGELIDPFAGLKDLKAKMIRTPLDPEITFSDDPLRMMRAIRFAGQLKFDIVPDTFDAIIKNADRLKIVSMERITDELNKIILADQPSYGFKLLFHAGLLEKFFPEMTALYGRETINNQSHKDNFYHTLQVLDNLSEMSDDLWVRWSAILHDIAKPATKRYDTKAGWTFHGHEDKGARMVPAIFRKLKLPLNDKMKLVQKLVKLHLRPIALVSEEISDSAVRRLLFEAGDAVEPLMKLCRADITTKDPRKAKRFLQNFDLVERKFEEVEAKDKIRNFQPPVSGEDIMASFKIRPSKVVGEIKEEIKEAILDGEIRNNFTEAYQLMIVLGKKKNLTLHNNLLEN